MDLFFDLPDGTKVKVSVNQLLNGGWAGRTKEELQKHIDEARLLGISGPTVTPILMPISPYLAQQTDDVWAPHEKTSGEAEWGLVVTNEEDLLFTLVSDHTDRALEVHGIRWSKNAAPDVLSRKAWRYEEIESHSDKIILKSWVTHGENEVEIQSATLETLLPPSYWMNVMRERNLLKPGTVLASGTINMHPGVNQFGDAWRAEMIDPVLNRSIDLKYRIKKLPEAIG
ncbi:MAG TPA: DUF2848 domain-containing protein, partial [Bellilinea sp.]|nr:DUF2848 domain-containing protein [Bellilinea sp.]